ncbi:hypothetical protein [Chitinivorax sp. B]|uniref:hypothetical protein n=1 Tax=Chitinivorax sp. B TaxID=2502235 RepID=UPI0010F59681|nr:hypothetical protein [Chitinivorax sp. B]
MKNLFYGLAAALIVMLLYRFILGGKHKGEIEARYKQPIISQLSDQLKKQSPLCIYEGPFPIQPDRTCLYCNTLLNAGLIDKQESGNDARYTYSLTAAGKVAYRDDPEPGISEPRPRLCMGDASLDSIVDALPSMELGGIRYLSFKYRIRVANPHPWLKDKGIPAMQIPKLVPTENVLDEVYTTTARIIPNSTDIEFDSGFRYGRWVNKP